MSGRQERDAGGEEGAAGGDLSMSIEETNKMRIALGLKPLKMEAEQPKGPTKEQLAAKEEEEKAAQAAELAARIKQTRERRQQQEALAREKKLGEAGADVDDVLSWVKKSRMSEAQRKAAAAEERRKAAAARAAAEAADSDDDDEGDAVPSAAELAGAKVKHSADELGEGETMILTLEDRGILDEKGELAEDDQDPVLENILAREDRERAKARKAAGKQAKPLWEEDGKRRGLLDKYDEEEEAVMQLDEAGALEARARRQEQIRARLAAGGGGGVAEDASVAVQQQAADYYTADEMAKFQKPKKKKERRLKKKALTEEELAALEQEAAARGGADLGSRASRAQRAADKAAAAAAADADRRARFDHALSKANYASLALRGDAKQEAEGGGLEEDDDLYQSLAKARQLAQKSSAAAAAAAAGASGPEALAAELIRRREEQAAAARGGGAPADAGLVFTDVAEFARTIHVKEEEEGEEAAATNGSAAAPPAGVKAEPEAAGGEEGRDDGQYGLADMDVEQQQEESKPADNVWAGWVPASSGAPGESSAAAMREKLRAKREASADERGGEAGGGGGGEPPGPKPEESLARERAIGSGLAGALAFLKDRGDLSAPVEWSGRNTDRKKVNVQGLDDVYTGSRRDDDKLALDVEVALTRKDEYGRVLTPKEAFRQLCHRFHGIQPSKNSREKRAKKAAEEVAKKKLASEVGATAGGASLTQMQRVQKQAATPYVVLSGTIKPGQSRDAASGYATVDRAEQLTSATPVLSRVPGGQGALLGNAKVEAMLGIKRPEGGAMPPPPPKKPRQ